MAQKFIIIAVVCALVALVRTAPQFDQQFQQQQQPQQDAKYAVIDGKFHQDPNLEYNFEWVYNNMARIQVKVVFVCIYSKLATHFVS